MSLVLLLLWVLLASAHQVRAPSVCLGQALHSDAGRDWGQEEKGMTEDEMAGWYHQLDGHGFKWTLGVGNGQGGLACCDSWGRKESDTTEWLIWSDLETWKGNWSHVGTARSWEMRTNSMNVKFWNISRSWNDEPNFRMGLKEWEVQIKNVYFQTNNCKDKGLENTV